MGDFQERRTPDPRVNKLVEDVSAIKVELARNTEITAQVRDVLTSFHIIGKVAKWVAAVASAVAAVYALASGWFGPNDITPR